MPQPVGTLLKSLDLLDELGRSGPCGVMQLSRQLGLDKSAASRMLATLRSRNYARLLPDGRYDLGLRLYELGHILQERLPFRALIAPYVDRLAQRTQESAYCVIYHHGEAVYLYESLPSRELHLSSRVGRRLSLFDCQEGKVVIVAQEEDTLRKLWQKAREASASRTPSWQNLQRELRSIRLRGYATERGNDIQTIVAPIMRDQPPICHAALLLGGPAFRLRGAHLKKCTAELLKTVREAGQEFGVYESDGAFRKTRSAEAAAG